MTASENITLGATHLFWTPSRKEAGALARFQLHLAYLISMMLLIHNLKATWCSFILTHFGIKHLHKKPWQVFKLSLALRRWTISNWGNISTVLTHSNGSVHHHGTDGEHQERDGKSNTGILCERQTVKVNMLIKCRQSYITTYLLFQLLFNIHFKSTLNVDERIFACALWDSSDLHTM